jgi:hypothetical protein
MKIEGAASKRDLLENTFTELLNQHRYYDVQTLKALFESRPSYTDIDAGFARALARFERLHHWRPE